MFTVELDYGDIQNVNNKPDFTSMDVKYEIYTVKNQLIYSR